MQSRMLELAEHNRVERSLARDRGHPIPDLLHSEVLHTIYGFPYDERRIGPHGLPLYAGHAFAPAVTERAAYRSARSSVCRAAQRLEQRRIARRVRCGGKSAGLVLVGVEVA